MKRRYGRACVARSRSDGWRNARGTMQAPRCRDARRVRSRSCGPSSARRRTGAECGRTRRHRSLRHLFDHEALKVSNAAEPFDTWPTPTGHAPRAPTPAGTARPLRRETFCDRDFEPHEVPERTTKSAARTVATAVVPRFGRLRRLVADRSCPAAHQVGRARPSTVTSLVPRAFPDVTEGTPSESVVHHLIGERS
jgi:hypothetical protein